MNSQSKKQLIRGILGAVGLVVLAGCSSTGAQRCPIDQDGYPSCNSMEEVFEHALNEDGDHLSVVPKITSEDEDVVSRSRELYKKANPYGSHYQNHSAPSVTSGIPHKSHIEHPYQSKPVYVPEQVHRAWFSPWENNKTKNLHSAEQVYFTTPGYWNFGTLNKTGSLGNAMLEPLAPDELGFSPDFSNQEVNIKNNHVQPEVTFLGN